MKIFLVVALLASSLGLSGCNAQQTATDFSNVISGILNIAQAEEPALPPADGAILTQWTNLGITLEAQLNGCIGGLSSMSKKSSFATCFNSFALGLTNPTELAQLRILSSTSQSKVELWVTAIVLGVNGALQAFGGGAIVPPTITTPPATADLNNLRLQLRSEGYAL